MPRPAPAPEMPSLREFEVLRAVVEHRTTAAAARALSVSQPAVSRALASLEGRLGRRLFVRAGGTLRATEQAVALSEGSRAAIGALRRLLGGEEEPGAGSLQIVTTATLSSLLLAPALPAFLRAHPGMRVGVEITTSSGVLEAVADGAADAGLLDGPAPHARAPHGRAPHARAPYDGAPHDSLSAEIVQRGRAHAVVPRGHPLAARAQVGVRDLAPLPLVALPRRFALRARLDAAFRDAGLRPRIAVECATAAFAAEMVLAGLGVGVLNAFPLRAACPGLAFVPFAPEIAMETAVVTPAGGSPSPALHRFADALRAHIATGSPPDALIEETTR